MDLAQSFIFDLGWVFFAVWAMVLLGLGAIAFGKDLFVLDQAPKTKLQ